MPSELSINVRKIRINFHFLMYLATQPDEDDRLGLVAVAQMT